MTTTNAINLCLKTLGLVGLEGVSVVAPNTLLGLQTVLKKSPARQANQKTLLHELRRQGLVSITSSGGRLHYSLTPAGVYRLQRVIISEITIPSPKQWDNRWRMVTFDVPLKQSQARGYFTAQLKKMGFMMLQKSMWVYPHPCFEQVEQLAAHYNVLRYCSLLEIQKLDERSTKHLLRHFSASL